MGSELDKRTCSFHSPLLNTKLRTKLGKLELYTEKASVLLSKRERLLLFNMAFANTDDFIPALLAYVPTDWHKESNARKF